MKASIIVPTRDMESSIRSLLDAIFAQQYEPGFDVLVMDSSDDKTPEIAGEFPVKIVRVEPEDYNYGRTRNEGAALTTGDLLVFISADIEITDPKWLSKLAKSFSDPTVAGVYGRQIPFEDAAPMDEFFINYAYPSEGAVMSFDGGKVKTPNMMIFSNVNSAVRRSVWEQIKIPEMLKSEDCEWAKRVLLAGYKIVYDAEAAVRHSNSYTLKSMFREYFDAGTAMPVVSREHLVDHSFKRFVSDGIVYVLNEYWFILRTGRWRWLPYAVLYDMSRLLGAFLGSRQKYLPLWLKRALCKKKNHWDQYPDIIKEPA